jgi:lactoylglutathione lyase
MNFSDKMDDYKSWMSGINSPDPHFLHMMVIITDIERSLRFYRDGLGMKLLGGFDVEERRVTALFVGYKAGAMAIELAYYWDHPADPVTHGTGFRHIALGVPRLEETVARLEALPAEIYMRPTTLVEGMPRAAFVKDPDGYLVELFQTLNA